MKYGSVETEKLYFSSSEAAEQIGVPVDVLHSWEKEFPDFKPKKNKNGKRIYRQSDIEAAKQIKESGSVSKKEPVPKAKTKKIIAASNKDILLKIRDSLQDALDRIK